MSPTNLVTNVAAGTDRLEHPPSSREIKRASLGSVVNAEAIRFGSPSTAKTATMQAGSEWKTLLKETASGGIASLLGGGLAGIGLPSIISGIADLLSGSSQKATAPALVRFQLPGSQNFTSYVGAQGGTVYQGSAIQPATRPTPGSGIYGETPSPAAQAPVTPSFRYQSTEIAQAVKQALLNSSTLNDVIAEI